MYEHLLDYHRLYAAYEDCVIQDSFVVSIIHPFFPLKFTSALFSISLVTYVMPEDIGTNNYAFLGGGRGSRGVRVYHDQYEK